MDMTIGLGSRPWTATALEIHRSLTVGRDHKVEEPVVTNEIDEKSRSCG